MKGPRYERKSFMNTIGGRIRYLRRAVLGLTQEEFALLLSDVSRGAVGNWEHDKGISRENLQHLAAATDVSFEWLATGRGAVPMPPGNRRSAPAEHPAPPAVSPMSAPMTPSRRVQVTGEVQAGSWREADNGATHGDVVNVLVDPRYSHMSVTALRVRGPSMDRELPDGSYVLCVSFIELQREPVSGEFVVVQRRIANGLTEATIKQYVVENGRSLLYPRSHDPRFQEPLVLNGAHDDEEIVITALAFQVFKSL
jgi:phage repressor protein C with HTH and peptisase S24 domain